MNELGGSDVDVDTVPAIEWPAIDVDLCLIESAWTGESPTIAQCRLPRLPSADSIGVGGAWKSPSRDTVVSLLGESTDCRRDLRLPNGAFLAAGPLMSLIHYTSRRRTMVKTESDAEHGLWRAYLESALLVPVQTPRAGRRRVIA